MGDGGWVDFSGWTRGTRPRRPGVGASMARRGGTPRLGALPGRVLLGMALCLLLALASPHPAWSHAMPDKVLVQAIVGPEGNEFRAALHVPVGMLAAAHEYGEDGQPLDPDPRSTEDRVAEAAAEIAQGVQFYEDDRALAPSGVPLARFSGLNRAYQSLDEALRAIRQPPSPHETNIAWLDGYVDVYLRYPIEGHGSAFSMSMPLGENFGGLRRVFVRYVSADGAIRAYELGGSDGRLVLDPSWTSAAWTFGKLGFEHITSGIDHLLFLICLAIPFGLRHLRALVGVVTAFTIAHSITLIASASGLVPTQPWFPPLVETLIAVSILYMALENVLVSVLGRGGTDDRAVLRRAIVVGCFGLVHGFGFSFILREQLQFAGTHLLLSLVSFNLGVEVGQLAFLAIVLPLLTVLLHQSDHRRAGIVIVSIMVANVAWGWLAERWTTFATAALPVTGDEALSSPGTVALMVVLVAAALAAAVILIRRWLLGLGGLGADDAGDIGSGRAAVTLAHSAGPPHRAEPEKVR